MLDHVYPVFNPVAFSVGPFAVRWYALAYLVGFLLGWRYGCYIIRTFKPNLSEKILDDFLTYAVLGTIIGGRLGYILIYQPDHYADDYLEIFKVWHGGMSFHGGLLGVITAAYIYTRRQGISYFEFTDVLAAVVPIGLALGRAANFINGELYGRISHVPWALVFSRGGSEPRHPSQLYEALGEGVVLFFVMLAIASRPSFRARPGFMSGSFLALYGAMRLGLEVFREPDVQLGFFIGGITMGQLLCVPMILFGVYLILWSDRRARRRTS